MAKMIKFIINNTLVESSLSAGTVLLDLIRDDLKLTGTKEGCREGECGACTILLGELLNNGQMSYKACASCLVPIGEARNKHVVTIEGLNKETLTAVQQAIFDNSASQCGFCTPGIVLSLTGFLFSSPNFSNEDAINAMDGNICRCTGYVSIKNAAKTLSDMFSKKPQAEPSRIEQLVKWSVIPEYFLKIPQKLSERKKNTHVKIKAKVPIIVAGATDLLIQRPDELINSDLEFISLQPELSKIVEDKDFITIGAGVTVEQFRTSKIINKYFPTLKNNLLLLSSTIVRNKATIAGNIVNASPIADMAIILLPLNVNLILKDGNNKRSIQLKDFYNGYKILALRKNETIEKIRIPFPVNNAILNFEKVSNRKYLDIASCNSAMYLHEEDGIIEDIKISAGGVAPIPLLLEKTSNLLKGKQISNEILQQAKQILQKEITPIDDIRGTAEYKKLLLGQLLFAHFDKIRDDR